MTPELVVSIFSQAVWLIMKFVCILVLPSLFVGLVVAVFQAATQVNEQTLSFLPRLMATLATMMFAGHWLISDISDFFNFLFINIPGLIG